MDNKKMKIKKFSTFIKIENPEQPGMKKLIDNLSTMNFHTRQKEPYAYFYDKDKDVLRVPVGVGMNTIYEFFDRNDYLNGGFMEIQDKLEYDMSDDPFPRQSKVIKSVYERLSNDKTQAVINLPTGRGKTYTGIYLNHLLQVSSLIFVYENRLQNQWAEKYLEHTDIDPEQIYILNGSKDIVDLIENGHKYNIFIVTHATVRSFIKKYNMKKFNNFLFKCDIGLKIFDEFDRESVNMFNVDCHSSILYNLYLSATPFRSSRYDDQAFQFAFKNTHQIGVDFYKDVTPNRKSHFIFYHSNPDENHEDTCHQWRYNPLYGKKKGETKWNRYFDINNYHLYLLGCEENYNPKDEFIETLGTPIKELKSSIKKDETRKHIICTGRIDNCPKMKRLLIEKFDIDPKHIGLYNSEIDSDLKDEALDKPIIISLSSSMGRGLDIKNIYMILDVEAYGSASIFTQLVGRCGRIGGIEGMYYKVIDLSFINTYRYYKDLKPYIDKEFKDVKYTKLDTEKSKQ